jgi:MoxR-like ATPase
MSKSMREINEIVQKEAQFVQPLLKETARVIVGQEKLINRILIGLLSGGHILIEGVPGLAKTLTVKTLSATLDTHFQRVQFTPDLLPSDLIGTLVYNPQSGQFTPKRGPIFANVILADEINRAPAKVQSALLECMEEKQITLGETTYPLPEPFIVLATQNPVEQEGTYPLPEAQLDRFMLKVVIGYPSRDEERSIVERMSGEKPTPLHAIIQPETILKARKVVDSIYVDPKITEYVLNIVSATRKPAEFGFKKLQTLIEFGASPRATIALVRAAKAQAFLNGRGFVTPDDIKALALDVLRHRIITTFEAQAENVSTFQIINQIVKQIEVP